MDTENRDEYRFAKDQDQGAGQAPGRGTEPGQAGKTSQAERAAMHPEPHDVEWKYYFGAWSQ